MTTFIQFLKENAVIPAKFVSHSEYKKAGPRDDQFLDHDRALAMYDRVRHANPKADIWMICSLGISWHDPQAMGKLMVGNLPSGIKAIRTQADMNVAWDFIAAKEGRSHSLSRRADY